MARLIIKSDGFLNRVINLNLGVNRFGRSSECDFQIDHATVSATHCQLILTETGVTVCDCDSTNGTFIDGQQVKQANLSAGQSLRLGDVELLVEDTLLTIAIPKFDVPLPSPPVVLPNGSFICPRHPEATATHQCTHCREVLCDLCVHRLRRRGGKVLKLCPLCSHPAALLGEEKKPKRSLLQFLQKTVKLPFLSRPGKIDEL